MSTTAHEQQQLADESVAENWFVGEPVERNPNWGPFLPWRAAKAICRLTQGNTQHIALILAMKTPRDGKWFVVQKKLAIEIGRAHSTVGTAIKELFKLGILIKAKRTMGGFDIVWGKVAYGITESHNGHQGELTQGENTFSDVKEIRNALRLNLRPAYCTRLVERYPDDLTQGSPEVRRLALLTDSAENLILDNLVFLATSQKVIPTEQIASLALERFMKRKGSNDFLIKQMHPLQRFSQDVGRIVCRMLAEIQKSKDVAEKPTTAPNESSRRALKYSAAEIEEHRKIHAQRMASLPKNLRPKFYTDTAG